MRFKIREAGLEDLPALKTLVDACFAVPWTEGQLAAAVSGEGRRVLAAFSPETGAPAGMLALSRVLDEGSVDDLAVFPEHRRRGAASALLGAAEARAREWGLAFLTLEVRASNAPAVALYEKHGYQRAGLRRGYYENPREDALLLTRFLTQGV